MKSIIEKKQAAAFQNCKVKAIKEISRCFHPDCSKKSINSHILQKNGILSNLEKDRHLMEMRINPFRDEIHHFEKIGINVAYSFNCFCNEHDTDLFKKIETDEIDFNDYESLLLFTLRTVYNEKFRKLVNHRMRELLIEKHSDLYNIYDLTKLNIEEKLGISDIEKTENLIWKDLNEGTESFVFLSRKIKQIPICLSAFYNYETTEELEAYKIKHGIDKENVSDIFINVFPFQENSIFMMGYKKQDEMVVKQYVHRIVKERPKRLLRQFTNLLLFQCETWVTSIDFYNERIKKCEEYFGKAADFSGQNKNERVFFKLNLFGTNFCSEIKTWHKNIYNYPQR
jgi:hypothetical protein